MSWTAEKAEKGATFFRATCIEAATIWHAVRKDISVLASSMRRLAQVMAAILA